MSSAKRMRSKANEPRPVQHGRGATRARSPWTGWLKKFGAVVGVLATFVGLLVTLLGPPGQWFEKPDTSMELDSKFGIINVDGEQFELRAVWTLINQGHKQDSVHRPQVTFTSDRPVVNCLPAADFTDVHGKSENFPFVVQKESNAKLICIIKWKPTADYYSLLSAESRGTQQTRSAILGRITLTWPGENRKPVEKPFVLLAAETIRDMKPGVLKSFFDDSSNANFSDVGDGTAQNATPSTFLFGLPDPIYRAAGIEMGSPALIASTAMPASPVQAPPPHDAVKGEIASGKEVPSPNPNEAIVNIRPCGGTPVLVIFRAQFRKRSLGALPCGVQIVQVEKL
jgi:hypothetical protein